MGIKNLIIILLFAPVLLFSQSNDELKQRVSAFVAEADSGFTKKDLSIATQDIGGIPDTDFEWTENFMLKSRTKVVNNIGNKSYPKYYFSFFTYYDVTERDYAMQYWLKNFLEKTTLRTGRTLRTMDGAQPTIIVINQTNISILTYQCVLEEEESFKEWRRTMLKWFGSPASIIIEINCDGPLEWTKNIPDSKDRSWR